MRTSQPQHQSNLRINRSRRYFANMRNGFTSRLTKHLSLFEETRSTSRSLMSGSCCRAGPRRELGGGEFTRGIGPGSRSMLQASRRMGAELSLIELVPRTSAKAIAATIRAARELRCDRLAQLACALQPDTAIERLAFEPRDQTRPARPLRSNSSQTKTRDGSRSLVQLSQVILLLSMHFFRRRSCGSDAPRIASSRRTFSNSG